MSDQFIASHRAEIKLALYEGDIDRAWFHTGIVVGLRICAGEIAQRGKRDALRKDESLAGKKSRQGSGTSSAVQIAAC